MHYNSYFEQQTFFTMIIYNRFINRNLLTVDNFLVLFTTITHNL